VDPADEGIRRSLSMESFPLVRLRAFAGRGDRGSTTRPKKKSTLQFGEHYPPAPCSKQDCSSATNVWRMAASRPVYSVVSRPTSVRSRMNLMSC
jgi:hypothetical protein